MADRRQTSEDLREQLARQVGFLQRSAGLYDDGMEDEAVRIAGPVYVLVHGENSVLAQLRHRDAMPFLSSGRVQPKKPQKSGGLTITQVHDFGLAVLRYGTGSAPDLDTRYVPAFHIPAPRWRPERWTGFSEWWRENVIYVLEGSRSANQSRREVVDGLRNSEGYGHTASFTDAYYELTRAGIASPVIEDSGVGLVTPNPGPESVSVKIRPVFATMRQIAHEILVSLKREFPAVVAYESSAPPD